MGGKKGTGGGGSAKRFARGQGGRDKATRELIISKSRTKAASDMNVSGDFYGALDSAVRALIANAERRAVDNGRKTLRAHDL